MFGPRLITTKVKLGPNPLTQSQAYQSTCLRTIDARKGGGKPVQCAYLPYEETLPQGTNPELPQDQLFEDLYRRWRGGISLRRLETETGISRSRLSRKFKPLRERDRAAQRLAKRHRKWRIRLSNELLGALLCLTTLVTIYVALRLLR